MRYTLVIVLSTISVSGFADDFGFFAGLNIGHTKFDVSDNFENENENENESESLGAGVGLSVGYIFDSKVVTQVSATTSKNYSLFGAIDRYNLQHLDLSVGYKVNWQKLSFIPKIGYANWELSSKEGQLFNPGREESKEQSNKDLMWGGSIGYSIGSKLEITFSHKKINTSFGGYGLSHFEFIFSI